MYYVGKLIYKVAVVKFEILPVRVNFDRLYSVNQSCNVSRLILWHVFSEVSHAVHALAQAWQPKTAFTASKEP